MTKYKKITSEMIAAYYLANYSHVAYEEVREEMFDDLEYHLDFLKTSMEEVEFLALPDVRESANGDFILDLTDENIIEYLINLGRIS